MKYIFLLPNLAAGGVARTVACLAEGMAGVGFDVKVCLFVNQVEQLNELQASRIRVLLPGLQSYRAALMSFPLLLWQMAVLLRKNPGVIVSAHGLAANVVLALLKAFRVARFTSVGFQHDSPSGHYKTDFLGCLKVALWSWLSHRHDLLIAVSKGVRNDMAHIPGYDGSKLHVLYNGHNLDRIKSLARLEAPPQLNGIKAKAAHVVAMVGRLCEQKDYGTALRVAARLAQHNVHLVVVGEGPDHSALRDDVARKGLHTVHFLGRQSNPFAVIAQADAFLLTSRHEAFGNVLIEALALGVPVVSTDCPSGPSEILAEGRHGALAPVGDDQALAQLLLSQLHSADTHKELLRRAGLERAAQFDVAHQVSAYCQILGVNQDNVHA